MDKNIVDISKHFSDEAFLAIADACNLAGSKGQKVCSSVHLFKVLADLPAINQFITKSSFDMQKVLGEIDSLLQNADYPIPVKEGKVVFTPDLRATILRGYLIAKEARIEKVSVEELFLASLYDQQINLVIKKLGVAISDLEELILYAKGGTLTSYDKQKPLLQQFSTDLMDVARGGKLEEVVNREKELAQIVRILVRHAKNNVVLLGEVGVGRGAIVNLLAQKILSGQVSSQLKDVHILKLNFIGLTSALAMRNIGELSKVLQEELEATGNPIVFIENFDIFLDETSVEKTLIANILRSIISLSNVRFICTMTSTSYKKFITKERALAETFEIVKVSEPSVDLAIKILKKVAERLSAYHKVKVSDEVIQSSVVLSKRYIQDRFLPSKAIDLLDEASSKVVLEGRMEVTVDDVKSVISEKTGIPIEKLTISEQKKLADLEIILNKSVIGQEEAVHVVSEVIRRSRVGLKDPKKPIGSFLFLGPSGVGKTYLAKNLTKIVYDNENAMIKLDMSEFSQSHTVQRLIGSPPGYVGYEEGGQLTNPIWERPYSLILLDEIEKAHPKVFDIFLQVLDEGRLTDGAGRTVDFKNTIIIATSNIASDEILEKITQRGRPLVGFEREQFFEKEIMPILRQYFRPEFINRFDEVVLLNPLSVDDLVMIARLQIEKIQKRLVDKKITLAISEQKFSDLAQKAYNPAFGARPLIRLIQDRIENVIARKIISGEIKEGDTVNF